MLEPPRLGRNQKQHWLQQIPWFFHGLLVNISYNIYHILVGVPWWEYCHHLPSALWTTNNFIAHCLPKFTAPPSKHSQTICWSNHLQVRSKKISRTNLKSKNVRKNHETSNTNLLCHTQQQLLVPRQRIQPPHVFIITCDNQLCIVPQQRWCLGRNGSETAMHKMERESIIVVDHTRSSCIVNISYIQQKLKRI